MLRDYRPAFHWLQRIVMARVEIDSKSLRPVKLSGVRMAENRKGGLLQQVTLTKVETFVRNDSCLVTNVQFCARMRARMRHSQDAACGI